MTQSEMWQPTPVSTVVRTTFTRVFAMPNKNTFSIKPISELLDRALAGKSVVVDPFARDSRRGTLTNDIDLTSRAQSHMEAVTWLDSLSAQCVTADAVLFDPPYSPRQMSEAYKMAGIKCSTQETQNAHLYAACKKRLATLLRVGGIAVCCGWNSMGIGLKHNFVLLNVLLVCHGAAHNDTIVTVEVKVDATDYN